MGEPPDGEDPLEYLSDGGDPIEDPPDRGDLVEGPLVDCLDEVVLQVELLE
jgi:hypothetical protein